MPCGNSTSPLFGEEGTKMEAQERYDACDELLDTVSAYQSGNRNFTGYRTETCIYNHKARSSSQSSSIDISDRVEKTKEENDGLRETTPNGSFVPSNYGSLLGRSEFRCFELHNKHEFQEEACCLVGDDDAVKQRTQSEIAWQCNTLKENETNVQNWSNMGDEENADSVERRQLTSFCHNGLEKQPEKKRSKVLWGTLREFVKDFDLHEYSDDLAQRGSENAVSDQGGEEHDFLVDWKEILLFLCVFFAASVFGYSYVFENWKLIDSIYFSVVTFTTVGYGDMHPTNTASRIFTCCLALCSITYIGFILGVLGNKLVAAEIKALSKARNASARYFLRLIDANNSQNVSLHSSLESLPSDISCSTIEDYESIDEAAGKSIIATSSSWFSSFHEPARAFLFQWVPFACIVAVGASIMVSAYGWSGTEALYFWIVTATTIGFGDFHPKHNPKGLRLLSVFLIPLAVGLMGVLIGGVAKTVMQRRRKTHMQGLLRTKLNLEDLDRMDADGDGRVTRLEYVEYMLIVMKLVDPETLRRLHGQFAKLDVDGCGTLSRNDLEIMAKRRKKALKTKLQLASYKYSLLHQGGSRSSLCTCCKK